MRTALFSVVCALPLFIMAVILAPEITNILDDKVSVVRANKVVDVFADEVAPLLAFKVATVHAG